jgi:hypothetical protein
MENSTVPYAESGGCGTHNTCVAVISIAVALGMIICCYCCGIGIRIINTKYKNSPLTGQDPMVVVVYNKASTTAASSSQDEDPC